jgi:hypothetical protein
MFKRTYDASLEAAVEMKRVARTKQSLISLNALNVVLED